MNHQRHPSSRRDFMVSTGAAGFFAGLGAGLTTRRSIAADTRSHKYPYGKAEHVIMLWLGGGASQVDTWDPKRLGDAKKRMAGGHYPAIDTAIKGVKVCEHLKGCAKVLDRFVPVRSVFHNVVDEHAAATNRMHTGRPTSGTIQYPSIGSIIAHERGAANPNVPAYVIMGYPNLTRGPGFLGAKAGYLYLLDTKAGPAGLARPKDITRSRQHRREQLLANLREQYVDKNRGDQIIKDYDESIQQSLRLAGPEFMNVFNLDAEPKSLRQAYGGEFGQRCLLARRLIQTGVRFIEVSHNLNFVNGTGWDTHNQGQRNQHLLIKELDTALSTLVLDLEKKNMLDKTLIVVNTEFGRPSSYDGGGGRGHQSTAFSCVLAGGGLKTGQAIGVTDELCKKTLERKVSVPDFFATIHCAMGIDPSKHLHDGDRPVPITDMGQPIRELFG